MANIITRNKQAFIKGSVHEKIDAESFNYMVFNILEDIDTLQNMKVSFLDQLSIFDNKILDDLLNNLNSSVLSIETLIKKYEYLNNNKRFTTNEVYNFYDNTTQFFYYFENIDPINIIKISSKLTDLDRLQLDKGLVKSELLTQTEVSVSNVSGILDTPILMENKTIYDKNESFVTNFVESENPIGNTYYFITDTSDKIDVIYNVVLSSSSAINTLSLTNISDLPFTLKKIRLQTSSITFVDVELDTEIFYEHTFRFPAQTCNSLQLFIELNSNIRSNVVIQKTLSYTLQSLVSNPSLFMNLVTSNEAINNSIDYEKNLYYIFSLGVGSLNLYHETINTDDGYFVGKPTIIKKLKDFGIYFEAENTTDTNDYASYPNLTTLEPYIFIENYNEEDMLIDSELLEIPNFNYHTTQSSDTGVVRENIIFTPNTTSASATTRFTPDTDRPYQLYEDGALVASNIVDNELTITTPYTLANGAVSAGATTINVDSTASFPASGTAYFIDTIDEFNYSGVTATSFTGVTGVNSSHLDNTPISGFKRNAQYIYSYIPNFTNSIFDINVHDTPTTEINDRFTLNDGEISGPNLLFRLTSAPDTNKDIIVYRINSTVSIPDMTFTISNERYIVFPYDPDDATYTNALYDITYTPKAYTETGDQYKYKNDGTITTDISLLGQAYSYSKLYPIVLAYNPVQNFNISRLEVLGTSNTDVQPIINYNDGSTISLTKIPTGLMADLSIPINNVGSIISGADIVAKRVLMDNIDNPANDLSALTVSDWESDDSLNSYEAVTVNGILKHDSTKNAVQYATFFLRRSAVSRFRILVTGTYQHIWVKMFGISGLTNTVNDWLDMSALYDGTGIPGDPPNSSGCAYSEIALDSGDFTCTFGEESSTNSTNNIILIRFRLESEDQITRLEFRGI